MGQLKITRQRGFVSLFSVIFFMLFITVITVGFLRIMTVEQQQALDNDLSASALAAAQSGIEDGKRAILKYYSLSTTDPLYSPLQTALTSTSCNALTSSNAVRTALGLDTTGGGNIVNNSQINQSYSCLTVNLNSPDYVASSSAGISDFVPLRSSSAYDQIKVSWHLISDTAGVDGDGVPGNASNSANPYSLTGALPTIGSWNTNRFPAYLRVQLYGYPKTGSFDRARLESLSHSYALIPSRSSTPGAVDSTTPINFGVDDPRGLDQPKVIVRGIQCIPNPGSNVGSYACTATLELPTGAAFSSASNNYHLRITPLYGQSHFRVALQQGGAPVQMEGVQPTIDVTGKAQDVFRRLQARVRIGTSSTLPEYAAESANTICKNMQIADAVSYQANNCP